MSKAKMTSDLLKFHSQYIKNYLVNEIMEKLDGESLVTYEIKDSGNLDGFMSALYNIALKTKTADGEEKDRLVIVKFMKGDDTFRLSSKSYIQFGNEIFIYSTVIPEYEKILQEAKIPNLTTANWVPYCYVAKYGYVEGLSSNKKAVESVLALENLKPKGYKLGPRLYLTLDQLFNMCNILGEYHSMTYVLRETNSSLLDRLIQGITPLSFVGNDRDCFNFYDILYRLAFDRFYEYYERKVKDNTFNRKDPVDLLLIECLNNMKEKYFEKPTELLELIRNQFDECSNDKYFTAILHGDYNRNNVLFHAKNESTDMNSSEEEVDGIKMIDFQELRYATPAIDLSFFMYFNSTKYIRENHWDDLLMKYHTRMFQTLNSVLKANKSPEDFPAIEDSLKKYSYENFVKHFTRYALYGVLVCLHFLPWLLCSEEECAILSEQFEKDMYGEAFRKISLEAGGDEVNEKILDIVRHACRLGYLDFV